MKRYDILKLNSQVLEFFLRNKISLSEVRNIKVFEDFVDLCNHGNKVEYAANIVSKRYGITQRSVYNIARRMRSDIII